MKYTCQSEYLPMHEVFVHPVSDAFISEAKIAREWKSLNYLGRPDLRKGPTRISNLPSAVRCRPDQHHFNAS